GLPGPPRARGQGLAARPQAPRPTRLLTKAQWRVGVRNERPARNGAEEEPDRTRLLTKAQWRVGVRGPAVLAGGGDRHGDYPDEVRYRRGGASVVLVLLLGLIGSLARPGWNPQPLEETLVSHTEDTTIGSDVPTDPVGTYDVRSQVVDVAITDEVTVEATITEPVGAPDPRPGMVFMHGAGTATHENFADTTAQLASAGSVTMVPDKRADNYTTRDRDYVATAEDRKSVAQGTRARV